MQSLLWGRNKSPPQSIGGSGLASISTESSVSDSIVVVDVVVVDGVYVGFHDVVDSYVGCWATVVDSIPRSTSVMMGSKSEALKKITSKKTFIIIFFYRITLINLPSVTGHSGPSG